MNMKDYLGKEDTVGKIRFQIRHPSGRNKVWIIVEGASDEKIFSRLIKGAVVEEINGVDNLLHAVSELIQETKFVIGIRDADFMHLENKEPPENVFITDFHDIEMMLAFSDTSYIAVATEFLPKEKRDIRSREEIIKSIRFLGALRWINYCENIGLNFNKISFVKFYDGKTFKLNKEECLKGVLQRSQNTTREPSIAEIEDKIKHFEKFEDFLNLCNGHDFQKAFTCFVFEFSRKNINIENVGKLFRTAYTIEDFKKTKLYHSLNEWSRSQGKEIFKKSSEE